MRRKFFSLQYKFLIVSFLLVLVPLLIVSSVSYFKSSQILLDKIGHSNLQTLKQVGQNIDFIIAEVQNTSLYLIQNQSIRDFLKMKDNLSKEEKEQKEIKAYQELMYLISIKDYVHSAEIRGDNLLSISTGKVYNSLSPDIKEKLTQLRGRGFWFYDKLADENEGVYSFLREIYDINDLTRKLGWMRINISEEKIAAIYADYGKNLPGDIYIIDLDKNLLSSTNTGEELWYLHKDFLYHENIKNGEGFYVKEFNYQQYLISYYKLSFNNLYLFSIIPLDYLTEDIGIIKRVTNYAIILSLLICLILTLLFYYRVLYPLKKVRQVMKEVERGNFAIKLSEKGNDEIALISKSFNKMSSRLSELIEKVYLSQIKEKEMELKALQAQINPHFLYNTLDTIYWMSRIEKAYSTAELIHALGKLFRFSINNNERMVFLADEIEHLKSYLTIQRERYRDMVDFEFNIDESLLNCRVMKFILQPLVENALVHGIEAKGEKGTIRIDIYREDKYLIYQIEDNGAGADEEEIRCLMENEAEGKRGIGLKNVNYRLKLYYGKDCGLIFKSKIGVGTRVIVKQYMYFASKGEIDNA